MRRRWVQFVGTIGALANWTIPVAAISNVISGRDPSLIDPKMTSALCVYSIFFIRWSLAIEPANYPLLVCHACNEIAQLTEFGRWINWRFLVGKTKTQQMDHTKK